MDLSLIPWRIGRALGLTRKSQPLPGPQRGAVAERQSASPDGVVTGERYVREAKILEMDRLTQLRREGILSESEFEAAKQKLNSATTLRWEFDNLNIPLNISVQNLGETLAEQRADEAIRRALRNARVDGWQEDDMTDAHDLATYDRINRGSLGYNWESVDIRVKRLV